MSAFASVAIFLVGVYLSMRLIAAFYRIVDLWYAIGAAYPAVLRGILGWSAASIAIFLLIGDRYRAAFSCGLLSFVAFYLSVYVLRHFLVPRPDPR